MGFRVINGVAYPVGSFPLDAKTSNTSGSERLQRSPEIRSFKEILKEETQKNKEFTISNHAAIRMEDMNFDKQDLDKINEAINKAQDKGAKNCLIVYREIAMVTSVENRTVITAVSGERAKENVFTNIDSVVLL